MILQSKLLVCHLLVTLKLNGTAHLRSRTQTNSLLYVISQFAVIRSLIILRNDGNRSSQSAAWSTIENVG
jgi:hypothetical protein